jgi:hypothetical protein
MASYASNNSTNGAASFGNNAGAIFNSEL